MRRSLLAGLALLCAAPAFAQAPTITGYKLVVTKGASLIRELAIQPNDPACGLQPVAPVLTPIDLPADLQFKKVATDTTVCRLNIATFVKSLPPDTGYTGTVYVLAAGQPGPYDISDGAVAIPSFNVPPTYTRPAPVTNVVLLK